MSSVCRCTFLNLGSRTIRVKIITDSKKTTKQAVSTESSQLLLTILMTAQTAITGALIRICRPMAMSIWIWVTSLVVLTIRLGTEKPFISCLPKEETLSKISSLTA